MKFGKFFSVFAASTTAVNAIALLAVFPDEVHVGHDYSVEWLANATETLSLLLVKGTGDGGWKEVDTLIKSEVGKSPGGSYLWKIPDSTPVGRDFALWLSSDPIPYKDRGYADITQWFTILPAKKEDHEDLRM